ncbi:MAG: hypothetical protein EXR69_15560 [Myxococcales bacterium]|nr:hypothetical protein [Myxococcales bacterium]
MLLRPLRLALALLMPLHVLGGCRASEVKPDTSTNIGDSDGDTDSDDSGVVVEGDLSVSPASIDLAILFVGQQATAEVTLTNLGAAPISSNLSFVGGWSTS